MDISNWIHRIEVLEGEKNLLLEELDSFVNDVCEVILEIADGIEKGGYCPNCEKAAKSLFSLIEEHGDDNAVTDMLEQFAYKTGISLNGE